MSRAGRVRIRLTAEFGYCADRTERGILGCSKEHVHVHFDIVVHLQHTEHFAKPANTVLLEAEREIGTDSCSPIAEQECAREDLPIWTFHESAASLQDRGHAVIVPALRSNPSQLEADIRILVGPPSICSGPCRACRFGVHGLDRSLQPNLALSLIPLPPLSCTEHGVGGPLKSPTEAWPSKLSGTRGHPPIWR